VTQHKLLVVGEFIGKVEKNGPFTNRAGMYFREMMANAGINPDRAAFAYPTSAEELDAEMVGNESLYVVLSGNNMLELLHPELRIGECHGRAMLYDPDHPACPVLFPTLHHESAARQPKRWGTVVQDELALLRVLAINRDRWSEHTPDTCVRCRGELSVITPAGVVYCNRHFTPTVA
jgi:hypothetical protein